MNAILREEREVPVLTNEAIEVHLSYLRPGVEAVQAELPELRKEIKALDEKLSEKIDHASKDRAAGDASLGEKIDKLSERVLAMQGNQKGLILFLSSVGLLASGLSIAHTFSWI